MRLYHFTHPGTYLRIAAEGLVPSVSEDDEHMTRGLPVVWLTRQESNVADVHHIAHMVKVRGCARAIPAASPYQRPAMGYFRCWDMSSHCAWLTRKPRILGLPRHT
jgi:hypothetical protein